MKANELELNLHILIESMIDLGTLEENKCILQSMTGFDIITCDVENISDLSNVLISLRFNPETVSNNIVIIFAPETHITFYPEVMEP